MRVDLHSGPPVALALNNRCAVPAPIRARFFEKHRTLGKRNGSGLGTYSAKLMTDTMGLSLRMETSDADNSTRIHLSLLPTAPG
ncbi:hypothetical protein [Thiorhodovibrio winogradskyi]|uniref:hypothetical protein n=1 Tax=Thiorhodovibrio winogradskyi TaxID=77007 RepID=UPI0038B44D6F